MKNITLDVIGQRILADILLEMKDVIKMNILFFETLNHYQKEKNLSNQNNVIIAHFSIFEKIEKLDDHITDPIIYLTDKKKNINIKSSFQKYSIVFYPCNFKNFIEKINLTFMKSQFFDNSKINLLNYKINLNTKEIFNEHNKLKLTEREKNFLLFLKNSNKPQTIKNILKSVWGYSNKIETHTVETHVHRLRKKFLNSFKDSNFIKNNKNGYYI